MFYMIRPTVMFRNCGEIGYITDNALFGYRVQGDEALYPGERYVSGSGVLMLDVLGKRPRHIDEVVAELCHVYVNVPCETIKKDAIGFYDLLSKDGFLSCGMTKDECIDGAVRRVANDVVKCRGSYQSNVNCLKLAMAHNESLKSIHLELATECNERCVHCYIPHKCKVDRIDFGLVSRLLDEARDIGVLNVTLSGGEPLLHQDLLAILSKCREFDFSVNVLTNLTLLSDLIVDEMRKNPLLSVQTSIYSMREDVHDEITGIKGSLAKTLKAVQKLKLSGIPLQISCPIMQANKDSFMEVVSWGDKYGVQVATEFVIFASLDHTGSNLKCRLSIDDVGNAFDRRSNVSYVSSMKKLAEEREHLSGTDPICSVCRYYVCVSSTGKAYPCPGWQNKELGDLNRQTLKEIWHDSRGVKELRSVRRSDFGGCMQCKDKGYCNICMMSNSNEDRNGDAFKVNKFHCQVASLLHAKVDSFTRGR